MQRLMVRSLWGLAVPLLGASLAHASVIGSIEACYACAANYTDHTFDPSVNLSDGVGFALINTTSSPITNVFFNILVGDDNATADSFNVGTIAANSTVYVNPGVSDDGGSGHTFFTVTGSPRDTSDVGPNGNGVPFSLTGLWEGLSIVANNGSGTTFTPGQTVGPSNDGILPEANFLGGPNGNDACNDCFGPKVVATISTPTTTGVPEPTTGILITAGLAAGFAFRRRLA